MKHLNAFLLAVALMLLGYLALQIRNEWPRITRLIREEAEEAPFVNCFPLRARVYIHRTASAAFDLSDEELGEKAAEAIGDEEQVALAVCRAFGALSGWESTWQMTTGKERRALAAVRPVKGDSFLSAIEQLKDDQQALMGAARLFFSEGFSEKIPKGKGPEWSIRLAKLVLSDGWDDNKHIALRKLGQQTEPEAAALLREVFRGKVGKEIDLAKAWSQDPGLRATAAVMLAQQNDKTIQAEVKELLKTSQVPQDVAALEVALALFGDPSYIKKEHFQLRSYTIGHGGVLAIERFKGAHGMEALINGALNHQWGGIQEEAEHAFARIVGKKLDKEEIVAWWEEQQLGKEAYAAKKFKGLLFNYQIPFAAISPDGRFITSASKDDSIAKIWDAATGKQFLVLRGQPLTGGPAAFSADEVVTATFDVYTKIAGQHIIKIWNIKSGKEIRTFTLKGHEHVVTQLKLSPDGKFLASSSEDRTVRLWDTITGQEALCFRGHPEPVERLTFLPDNRRIVSTSRGGLTRIWDFRTGEEERTLPGFLGAMAASFDGKLLAGGLQDGNIVLWNVETGAQANSWKGHDAWVSHVAFSPDGNQLATTSWDKAVKVWNLTTRKNIATITGHIKEVHSIAFSPDGKRLLTASGDQTVKVWDIAKASSSR